MTSKRPYHRPRRTLKNPQQLYDLRRLAIAAQISYFAILYLQSRGCVPHPQFIFGERLLWNPKSQQVRTWLELVAAHNTLAGVNTFEPPADWLESQEPERLETLTVIAAAAGFDGRNLYRAIARNKIPPPDYAFGEHMLYRRTALLERWINLTFETKGAWNRIRVILDWNEFKRKHAEHDKRDLAIAD